MRRNCNLELCLFPLYDSGNHNNSNHHMGVEEESPMQNQEQPLTIFYDGKMCLTDVTEFQAKSILMLANKIKLQEKVKTPRGSERTAPTIVQPPHQLYSPGSGLSMKRSLQRFLRKRKNRVQEASPYHH